MANLDNLKKEINALSGTSDPDAFIDGYTHIFEAVTPQVDVKTLIEIIVVFRTKLPASSEFNDIRKKASALHVALADKALGGLIDDISARNLALTNLKGELDVHIQKGHKDAVLLGKIKKALGQAESTVKAIQGMVNALTDKSLLKKITGFVDGLGNIAGTFAPDPPSA